jgi:hypothetical protein
VGTAGAPVPDNPSLILRVVEAVPPDAKVRVVEPRLVARPGGEEEEAERLTAPTKPLRLVTVTVYVPSRLVGA